MGTGIAGLLETKEVLLTLRDLQTTGPCLGHVQLREPSGWFSLSPWQTLTYFPCVLPWRFLSLSKAFVLCPWHRSVKSLDGPWQVALHCVRKTAVLCQLLGRNLCVLVTERFPSGGKHLVCIQMPA